MSDSINMSGGIRDLSLNELDAVTGAAVFTFAGITVAINEQGVTGIDIGGIGIGVVDDSVCGYIGSIGGCI
jgi:hypothetical protein